MPSRQSSAFNLNRTSVLRFFRREESLFHIRVAAVAAAGTFIESGSARGASCFKNLTTECTISPSLQRHLMEGTTRNVVCRVRGAFRLWAKPHHHYRGCCVIHFFIGNLLLKRRKINPQPPGDLSNILRRKLRAVPFLEHGQCCLLAADFGRQGGLSESMGTPCLPELLTDCP